MNVLEIAMLKEGAVDRTHDLALRIISTTKDEYALEVVTALAITLAAIIHSEMKDEGMSQESANKLIGDHSAFVSKMVNEGF